MVDFDIIFAQTDEADFTPMRTATLTLPDRYPFTVRTPSSARASKRAAPASFNDEEGGHAANIFVVHSCGDLAVPRRMCGNRHWDIYAAAATAAIGTNCLASMDAASDVHSADRLKGLAVLMAM